MLTMSWRVVVISNEQNSGKMDYLVVSVIGGQDSPKRDTYSHC